MSDPAPTVGQPDGVPVATDATSDVPTDESVGAPGGGRARPSSPAPTLARRWPPTLAAAFAAAFAVWGFAVGSRPLADNSFFTHLATGRLLLEQGSIPSADPYSFTAAGTPWIVQSWLASLGYGLVDRAAGGAGLVLLAGVLGGLVGALVWRLSRPGRSLLARVVAAAFPLLVGGFMWSPRPLMFGLVCLCLVLLAAEGGLDPRWLVPVMWVWVNTHGSFPLGLVALGLLAWGARLDGGDGATELRSLRWAALGVALGVVNPLGPKLLVFPVELLTRADTLQKIVEWQSPSFASGYARVFLLQVVVAIVVVVRRPSWRAALPLVVFTAAALLGVRNIVVASIVLVPGAARGLVGLGSLTGRERGPAAVVAWVVALIGGVAVLHGAVTGPAYDLAAFPRDAVAWMDQRGLVAREDVGTATQDTVGNYLELLYGDRARAFFDDRVDMYPRPVVDDYLTLHTGSPGWEAVLDRRGVDVVLWSRTAPVSQLLAGSPDWRIGYQDGDWVVACRRGSAAAARC